VYVLKRDKEKPKTAKEIKTRVKEDEKKKLEDKKKCNACACVMYDAIDMRVKLFSFFRWSNEHTQQNSSISEKKYIERNTHTHTHTHKNSRGFGR
jgi:hypothetical protein